MHYITRLFKLVTLAVVLFLLSTISAQANVVIYSNLSSFLANTTATTTLDFEAQNPNGPNGYEYWGSSLTIGPVTFEQPDGRLFVFGPQFYTTNGLTSNYLNQNSDAPNGIIVSFASPISAVGMDLGIQNTWNGPGLDVSFTLSTGDVINTTAPMLYATGNAMSFFGFSSDVPFTSVHITDSSQGVAIDNFIYGGQSTPNGQVPEPTSLLLLGTGLGALGLAAWRRRK